MKMDLKACTIVGLSELIEKREISPVEVIDAFLARAHDLQEKTKAFITIMDEDARRAAGRAEGEILRGRYRGPLHGIPFVAKDLFFTQGVRTTCGSKILADFVPTENAAVIDRLGAAGAVLVGKGNMHEFAYGTTNLNPHYGDVRNPWDPQRVSGGSSGGSAAALAASCTLLALGTDTGGSVRIPSALCGTAGLKPTFGRVSKYGVYPLAWSLDHPGPMARTVADLAVALNVLAGYDPRDHSSKDVAAGDYPPALTGEIRDVRVGVPDAYFFEQIDGQVKTAVDEALQALATLGATVTPVHIPELEEASIATLLILSSEAASCLEKYHRTRPHDLGADIKARLDLGAFHPATHYLKAQRIRRRMQEHFARVLSDVDVLATPGVSITAPKLDESTVRLEGEDVPVGVALTRCTRIYNLVGIPSVCVAVGFSKAGLPIGMQIAGRPFEEATVLRVADAYERHGGRPPVRWPEL
jgi:aspartyl-tRNA(Asn)/glutamyl-tRNA(Gln) amidotransferase subunit A